MKTALTGDSKELCFLSSLYLTFFFSVPLFRDRTRAPLQWKQGILSIEPPGKSLNDLLEALFCLASEISGGYSLQTSSLSTHTPHSLDHRVSRKDSRPCSVIQNPGGSAPTPAPGVIRVTAVKFLNLNQLPGL